MEFRRVLFRSVQVNTSQEESKFGLHPDDLIPFVERLSDYPRLKPQGLMTLAIFSADAARVRICFRLLRELRDRAVAINPGLTQLRYEERRVGKECGSTCRSRGAAWAEKK